MEEWLFSSPAKNDAIAMNNAWITGGGAFQNSSQRMVTPIQNNFYIAFAPDGRSNMPLGSVSK